MRAYLDHAASAPVPDSVREAYTAALDFVGNPSSIHDDGRRARAALEQAREQLAELVGADPVEVTFTSGGTESVNAAIGGLWWAGRANGRTGILTSPAEHHATLDVVGWLANHAGATVHWVSPTETGALSEPELADQLRHLADELALITVLSAHNEVGTIQPVVELAAAAAAAGVPLHLDAIAAWGRLPINFGASGAAAMSLSGHKIGAPRGTGLLLVRRGASFEPLLHGGGQQFHRSGTVDVPGAVALAAAADLAERQRVSATVRMAILADRLADGILAQVPDATVRGDRGRRLPGNVHVTFAGIDGEVLLFLLDQAGFAVSSGAACRAGVAEPSHALLAMGLDERTAASGLRVTLGPENTREHVDALLAILPGAVATARGAYAA